MGEAEDQYLEKWLANDYRNPAQFTSDFQVTDIGYQNLTARLPELPAKYFTLVGELDHFYSETTRHVQNQMDLLAELSWNFENEVSSTKGWYWKASEGISFVDAISFYQTDSLAWNTMALFRKKARVLLFDLRHLREEAILNSLTIAEETGELKTNMPKEMKSSTYELSPDMKGRLKGAYRINAFGVEEIFHVSFLQDYLILRFSDNGVIMFATTDKDFFQGVSSEMSIHVRKNDKEDYKLCLGYGNKNVCAVKISGEGI